MEKRQTEEVHVTLPTFDGSYALFHNVIQKTQIHMHSQSLRIIYVNHTIRGPSQNPTSFSIIKTKVIFLVELASGLWFEYTFFTRFKSLMFIV